MDIGREKTGSESNTTSNCAGFVCTFADVVERLLLCNDVLISQQEHHSAQLIIKKIPIIRGVGVFCRRSFEAGDLVVRYMGTTLTLAEASRRDQLRTEVHKSFLRIGVCCFYVAACWFSCLHV